MTGYREWSPAGPVGGLLECAWQSRTGPDGPREQRVLPDGCMDLIVLDGRLVVAGPDTAAHVGTSEPGSVRTGLRFRPGALPAILGVPADALRDQRVPVAELVPVEIRPSVRDSPVDDRDAHLDLPGPADGVSSAHEAHLVPDPADGTPGADGGVPAGSGAAHARVGPARGGRLEDRDALLLLDMAARLAAAASDRRRPLAGPLPRWALRALARGASTADVADRLGVTTRTLHRTCTATLGYGPSVARRVLRFRAAAALLYEGTPPADVAARTGYADQPHLSREVRALAGVSPTALAAG